jgi:small-conductance mechanosensitive channel
MIARKKVANINWDTAKSTVLVMGVKVIVGILILIAFHIAGSTIKNRLLKLNEEKKTGSVAIPIMAKVAYMTCIVIAALLILRLFGMEIASIIAMISAVAFVIGMSLQGTLSDIASGVMLALFQTYNINDIIEIKESDDRVVKGKVIEFRLVNTIVEDVYTGVRVTIPNRKIQESIVNNYSSTEYFMVIFDFLLSNTNADFDKIIKAIEEDLKNKDNYPDIAFDKAGNKVFIYDTSEVGTKMRVQVPMTPDKLVDKKARIHTALRNKLASEKVVLVDPF